MAPPATRDAVPFASPSRALVLALLLLLVSPLHASIQFDVFLGYGGQPNGADGLAREASLFSVACEVLNDGPAFNAVFELTPSQLGRSQSRRFAVELPTNTRKRFVIPAFSGAGYFARWDARLLDERGRVRAEKISLIPRGVLWEGLALGAIPRTFGGLPKLPDTLNRVQNDANRVLSATARLSAEQLASDPVTWEGLDAVYLNSEKAAEIKDAQGEALVSWMFNGGHLVVAIEQASDLNASPWLKPVLPCDLRGATILKATANVEAWVRGIGEPQEISTGPRPAPPGNMARPAKYHPHGWAPLARQAEDDTAPTLADPEFLRVDFPVATGTLRDGTVPLAVNGTPLVIQAPRGRGRITVLTFSPEREPFRSWKGRDWLWVRLLEVPPSWFANREINAYGGFSVDSLFGAMIDSRQIRSLPYSWLLLLLAIYLVVIGPLDQWWLKKINRPMLTWITFPIYVVFFSVLIYYIGYRLRAGETEWNALHVVDVVPREYQAQFRGRSYFSIYSPVNATYRVASSIPDSTLRGEFAGSYSASQEGGRAEINQGSQGFNAEVFVPVWTSQLFTSDWFERLDAPFTATLSQQNDGLELAVTNRTDHALPELWLVYRHQAYPLGELKPGAALQTNLPPGQAHELMDLIGPRVQGQWPATAQQRYSTFGSDRGRWIDLDPENLVALSFLQSAQNQVNERGFLYPNGLELSPLLHRGDAVLLAWDPGQSPVPSLRQFPAVRSKESTLYRLALPVAPPSTR